MVFNVLYHIHQILFDEIIQVLSSKNALKNTLSLDGEELSELLFWGFLALISIWILSVGL